MRCFILAVDAPSKGSLTRSRQGAEFVRKSDAGAPVAPGRRTVWRGRAPRARGRARPPGPKNFLRAEAPPSLAGRNRGFAVCAIVSARAGASHRRNWRAKRGRKRSIWRRFARFFVHFGRELRKMRRLGIIRNHACARAAVVAANHPARLTYRSRFSRIRMQEVDDLDGHSPSRCL